MKLSVIIPTFNRKTTLEYNLHLLARQTLPMSELEVLVGDDGSTDGTVEMLGSIQPPYKLVVLETGSPPGVNGVTWAMNLGLEHATGEYVFFLDNDMLLKPDALQLVVDTLEEWRKRGEDVLVRGWWKDNRWLRRLRLHAYNYRHDLARNPKLRQLVECKDDLPVQMVHAAQMGLLRSHALAVGGLPRDNVAYGFDKEKAFQRKLKEQRGLRFVFEPRIFGLHGPFRGDITRFAYSSCPKRPPRWRRALRRLLG